jgi:hypothetical protein
MTCNTQGGLTEVCPNLQKNLLTYIQLLDQCAVFRNIFLGQIIEQTAAFADHLDEAALAVMIFRISLEMGSQRVDLLGQDGDLDFCLAAIFRIRAVFRDEALRLFLRNWHVCAINSANSVIC